MGLTVAVAMVFVQWLCRGYPDSSVAVGGAQQTVDRRLPDLRMRAARRFAMPLRLISCMAAPLLWPEGYFVAFLFSMFALNVLAAAASGLIPDIVRCEQCTHGY